MENKYTDEEIMEMVDKDSHIGPWKFLPWDRKLTFSDEALENMRTYKGQTDSFNQLFGGLTDKNAQLWSEDKNASAGWFNQPIPQAEDITNLMMAEALCATAIYHWKKEQGLI